MTLKKCTVELKIPLPITFCYKRAVAYFFWGGVSTVSGHVKRVKPDDVIKQ